MRSGFEPTMDLRVYSTFSFTDVKICRATFTEMTETFRFISAQKCCRSPAFREL